MKKFLSIILAILMVVTTVPFAFAAESDGVKTTLDVSKGEIIITDTYVTQNGENIELDPDGYIITGESYGVDTVLEFLNESTDTVTYNVVFDNLEIVAGEWCTALRFKGAGPMIVNIQAVGDNSFETDNHAAFPNHGLSTLTVNLTIAEDASFEHTRLEGTNEIYYSGSTELYINGEKVNADGSHTHTSADGILLCGGYKCKICYAFYGEGTGEHKGGIQTCKGYKCETCGEWYGEAGNCVGEEQNCMGYICDWCNGYYGEPNNEHYDRGNGFCRLCKAFVGPEIKAGETHKYDDGLFKYVKFVPVVDGTYIISADAPEYSYIDLYKEVDGKLKSIAFVAIDSENDKLALSYDYTAGETYYFICSNFAGEFFEYVTLSCETHQGTKQTCYGYVCDACGEYFGEALGHDIIVDAYVAPKCEETGLTAGQHCSRCDDMTVAQEVIPDLGGHINEDGDTACDRCGEIILCEACGRPVHEDTFIQNLICLIVMFINLVKSMF